MLSRPLATCAFTHDLLYGFEYPDIDSRRTDLLAPWGRGHRDYQYCHSSPWRALRPVLRPVLIEKPSEKGKKGLSLRIKAQRTGRCGLAGPAPELHCPTEVLTACLWHCQRC